jgi:hypothetical protein
LFESFTIFKRTGYVDQVRKPGHCLHFNLMKSILPSFLCCINPTIVSSLSGRDSAGNGLFYFIPFTFQPMYKFFFFLLASLALAGTGCTSDADKAAAAGNAQLEADLARAQAAAQKGNELIAQYEQQLAEITNVSDDQKAKPEYQKAQAMINEPLEQLRGYTKALEALPQRIELYRSRPAEEKTGEADEAHFYAWVHQLVTHEDSILTVYRNYFSNIEENRKKLGM